jgi:cyclopropane-fatty-acyl-phospholipid synthase
MSTVEALGGATRDRTGLGGWLARTLAANSPVAFSVRAPSGEVLKFGTGAPAFDLIIHNQAGLAALRSLNEPQLADAYIRGDYEIEGDFIAALSLRHALSDRSMWLKLWRRLEPWLRGRAQCNPAWIAKHYDMENIQFYCTDTDYRTYTPGIYENDHDSLEAGGRRKLDFAFRSLGLLPGDTVLDIGCGWGGFLRFAAEQGVRGTGITLSKHQHAFVTEMIRTRAYSADVRYQDFFSFESDEPFNGIVMSGVIEDLSDYSLVMQRLPRYLKPGGRVYMDFATTRERFDTSSFITRYIWPGTFRLVYMPEFMEAIDRSPFEVVGVYRDRHNYYLWSKHGYDRWMANKTAVVARAGIERWRMMRLLIAGSAALMRDTSRGAGAARVVLELSQSHSSL